jgi:GTP-binding protein
VDLPGYGYAKRSKTLRTEWESTLENYLRKRENLQCVFVLVDSRVPPQISDLSFINLLGEIGVPFAIVFTKLDKLKPAQAQANIDAFEEEMLKDWAAMPQVFQTSSEKKIGREDLLGYISQISKSFNVAKG